MAITRTCDGVRRRDFLRVGALGVGGLTLSSYLRKSHAGEVSSSKATSAIFINLAGGPSHMDTFDLKPGAPSEYRGEFNPIQTNISGIEISEHLPKLAQQMDKFALVRGVSHTLAAHDLGSLYVNTGNRPIPSMEFPGYGSVVSKELGGPNDLPLYVATGGGRPKAGYLGVQYTPISTQKAPKAGEVYTVRGVSLENGLEVTDVERRKGLLRDLDTTFGAIEKQSQLLEGLDQFGKQAFTIITSPRAREAFDTSKESPAYAEPFGKTDFGMNCLLASRLIESGVRFVTINYGGWDTHVDNWTTLKTRQLPPFDEGLAALLNGLSQKGLLASTCVFVAGEFGRTPKINTERNGRDHYPRAMFMLMSGGGIKTGQVLGATDEKASGPIGSGFTPDQMAATFFRNMGIDPHKEYQTNIGRPVMIVRDGEAIPELFA
jgi:hypothetical protein